MLKLFLVLVAVATAHAASDTDVLKRLLNALEGKKNERREDSIQTVMKRALKCDEDCAARGAYCTNIGTTANDECSDIVKRLSCRPGCDYCVDVGPGSQCLDKRFLQGMLASDRAYRSLADCEAIGCSGNCYDISGNGFKCYKRDRLARDLACRDFHCGKERSCLVVRNEARCVTKRHLEAMLNHLMDEAE